MKGAKRERRPGYWELRVYAGLDPVTKRQRYITRNVRGSARDADKALRALAVEVDEGRHRTTEGTVGHLLERWFEHASPSWSPTHRSRVACVIRRLVPALGEVKLSKLGAADLDAYYRRLQAEGLAPGTIRKVHDAMNRALRQAVRWGWLTGNVAQAASPPTVRQKPINPPAPAGVHVLVDLAVAQGHRELAALGLLAAATGARRGELVGLRWSDVDLTAGTVTIRRGVVIDEENDRAMVIKDTKTHAGRRIAIGAVTTAAVADHMAYVRERAGVAGEKLVGDPWLFSMQVDASTPWRPDLVTLAWRRLCRKAGVHVRLHDLRHFTATEMLDAGVPLRTVSGRLGHRRTSTTADIYAAWLPASDREAADALEARMESGRDKAPRAEKAPGGEVEE